MSATPLPDLILYGRPGCNLCDDTRVAIGVVFTERTAEGRPVPALVERDISDDPRLVTDYGPRIPVVELGDRRLDLVTSTGRLRRLLTEVLG